MFLPWPLKPKSKRTNQENIPDNSLELTAHLKSGDVEVSIFVYFQVVSKS